MNIDGSDPNLSEAPFPDAVAIDAVREVREKRKKGKKSGGKEAEKQPAEKKRRIGSERGVETMFRTSYRTHVDMSSLADSKANIMISINGIIISILLASISPKIEANPWLLVPTTVLLVGCVTAMVYAVLAARPRVSSTPLTLEAVRRENRNILFFGNFVTLSEADFVEGMGDLMREPEQLYDNMVRDIYSLGKVLQRKFALLRVSYTVFMIGLVASVILYLIVYLMMALAQPAVGQF
ncbi:MAG TPA: Pycsar system effector family protein [Longimicrobiaceae bacterium]|nr:Pycsar system effector family protein [Longimicrobiaceae bacterium]